MRRLVYLSSARDDLGDILRYVTRESGSLAAGEAFVTELQRHCERLAALPGTLGKARPELAEGLRSVPHKAYVIFFRYQADRVEIVDILSGYRDVETLFET